jgi:hypothetical protein
MAVARRIATRSRKVAENSREVPGGVSDRGCRRRLLPGLQSSIYGHIAPAGRMGSIGAVTGFLGLGWSCAWLTGLGTVWIVGTLLFRDGSAAVGYGPQHRKWH